MLWGRLSVKFLTKIRPGRICIRLTQDDDRNVRCTSYYLLGRISILKSH